MTKTPREIEWLEAIHNIGQTVTVRYLSEQGIPEFASGILKTVTVYQNGDDLAAVVQILGARGTAPSFQLEGLVFV